MSPSTRPKHQQLGLFVGSLIPFIFSTGALAQGDDDASNAQDRDDIPNIIVTGQRGQSATLFDNLDIEIDRGATGVEQLLRRAPNINFLGVQNGFINIRGENAEGAGNSALGIIPGRLVPTPFTVDGRPLAYGEVTFGAASIYDVAYVQIVRGPQTTSGGVNGAIGAVNVRTNDPTSDFEAAFKTQFGTFNQYQVAGLVSGEIIPGVLNGRVVIDYTTRDTYLDYTNPVFTVPEQFEFEQLTARAKVIWTPGQSEKLRIKTTLSYTDGSGPQTENVSDGPETNFERNSANVAAFLNTAVAGIVEVDYAATQNVSLKNHTAISSSDLERKSGNGTFALDQTTRDYQNEFSLQIESADGRLQWSPGLILRHQDIEMDWDYFGPTLLDDSRDSLGLYIEGTYDFSDSFRATAGLRYQSESQNRTGILASNTATSLSNPTPVDYDETFDVILPRLALEVDVREGVTIGGFVARGFTPGGFNFARPSATQGRGDGITPFELPEFAEETRWIVETYVRSSFLDDRLEILANIFYNDISDAQLRESVELAPSIFGSVVRNAEEATTYGLELAVTARPTKWMELTGSIGLLDTEIVRFSEAVNIEGNELERAPGFTGNFSADFEPIEGLRFGGNVTFVSGYFSAFNNNPLEETDDRTLVDLRVSYRLSNAYEIYVNGNNVFDERELTEIFGSSQNFGSSIQPRAVVLGLEGKF
ncbi:MAG: TonB-dependent receptor [Pseudomonadota bacterium]